MLDCSLALSYLAVAAILIVSPGPDTFFVVASGMRHGVAGAVVSATGIAAGSVVHGLFAAIGVSAIVASSNTAFSVLKTLGACYLCFIGAKSLSAAWQRPSANSKTSPKSLTTKSRVFRDAVVINLLNPKMMVFYMALLPQFVNPEAGSVGVQIFLLSCISNSLGTVYLIAVGCGAGAARTWLEKKSFSRLLDALAGLVFFGLAGRLILGQ